MLAPVFFFIAINFLTRFNYDGETYYQVPSKFVRVENSTSAVDFEWEKMDRIIEQQTYELLERGVTHRRFSEVRKRLKKIFSCVPNSDDCWIFPVKTVDDLFVKFHEGGESINEDNRNHFPKDDVETSDFLSDKQEHKLSQLE